MSLSNYESRLEKLLKSFKNEEWVSLEIGFYYPSISWDPDLDEHVQRNAGEHRKLVIKNGIVFNPEEIPRIKDILDEAEITTPLPEFSGKESILYTLNSRGDWTNLGNVRGEGLFYITFVNF